MDELIKAIQKLSSEQLFYFLLGLGSAVVVMVFYLQLPEWLRFFRLQGRRNEGNHIVLATNQKTTAALIVEGFQKSGIQLLMPQIEIPTRKADDDEENSI